MKPSEEQYGVVQHGEWDVLRTLPSAAVALVMVIRSSRLSTPIPGVCVGGPAAVAEELGWNGAQDVHDALAAATSAGYPLAFDPGSRVWLDSSAVERQPPSSAAAAASRARAWRTLPPSALKQRIRDELEPGLSRWLGTKVNPHAKLPDTFAELMEGAEKAPGRGQLDPKRAPGRGQLDPKEEPSPQYLDLDLKQDLDLDLEREREQGAAGAAPPARRPPKAVESSIPAEWEPNEDHRGFALRHALDLEFAAAKFRSNALAKGRALADWDAGFTTWLLEDYKREGERRRKEGMSYEDLTALADALEARGL